MKSIIVRDKKRRSLEGRLFYKRLLLKYLLRSENIQQNDKKYYFIRKQLEKLPRNSSATRLQNRCILTGYSHSVHKKFKLSRISIRNLGLMGQLAGLRKSSW